MKKILLIVLSFCLSVLTGCVATTTTEPLCPDGGDSYPATIRGRVFTDSGDLLTAGIIVTDEDGNMKRYLTNYLSGYTLLLEAGTYTLTFTRGFEYSVKTVELTVEDYKTYYVEDVRLIELHDSTADGWYLGDLHQHSRFSDGKDEVDQVLLSNIAMGLDFGFLSDHNSADGLAEWVQGSRFVCDYDPFGEPIHFLALRAVEITTDYGHLQSLGVGNVFQEADINANKGEDPMEEIRSMMEEVVRSGAIAQINHPFATSNLGFDYWEILDEFDTIEIWNGLYEPNANENLAAKLKWFELLNGYSAGENKFFPATGGSDNHDVSGEYQTAYADLSTPEGIYTDQYLRAGVYSGMPATIIRAEGGLTEAAVYTAIRGGHSYLTNGPEILATIGSAGYGDSFSLEGATAVDLDLDLFSRDSVTRINIYKNGETVVTVLLLDSGFPINLQETVTVEGVAAGDWIVIEVIGENTLYAITNPIFITA